MRLVVLLVLWTVVAACVGSTETSWESWSWTRSPRSVPIHVGPGPLLRIGARLVDPQTSPRRLGPFQRLGYLQRLDRDHLLCSCDSKLWLYELSTARECQLRGQFFQGWTASGLWVQDENERIGLERPEGVAWLAAPPGHFVTTTPDGLWLFTGDSRLFAFSGSGQLAWSTSLPTQGVRMASPSRAGTWIAATDGSGRAWVYSSRTGQLQFQVETMGGQPSSTQVLLWRDDHSFHWESRGCEMDVDVNKQSAEPHDERKCGELFFPPPYPQNVFALSYERGVHRATGRSFPGASLSPDGRWLAVIRGNQGFLVDREGREIPLGAISLHEPFGWLDPADHS